jgi:phage gp45-like
MMDRAFWSDLAKWIAPLKNRIFNMLARGVLESIKDNPNAFQELGISILSDDPMEEMERVQDYGYTSNPPDGSQVLVCFFAGNRSHGVVFRVDHKKYRVTDLEKGETALFTMWDAAGNPHRIVMRKGNKMELYGAEIKIGGATAEALVKFASMKAQFDSHIHGYVSPGGAAVTSGPVIPLLDFASTTKVKGA